MLGLVARRAAVSAACTKVSRVSPIHPSSAHVEGSMRPTAAPAALVLVGCLDITLCSPLFRLNRQHQTRPLRSLREGGFDGRAEIGSDFQGKVLFTVCAGRPSVRGRTRARKSLSEVESGRACGIMVMSRAPSLLVGLFSLDARGEARGDLVAAAARDEARDNRVCRFVPRLGATPVY